MRNKYVNQAWEKVASPKIHGIKENVTFFFLLTVSFGLAEYVIAAVKMSKCTELILVSLPVPTSGNSELSFLLEVNLLQMSGICQSKP